MQFVLVLSFFLIVTTANEIWESDRKICNQFYIDQQMSAKIPKSTDLTQDEAWRYFCSKDKTTDPYYETCYNIWENEQPSWTRILKTTDFSSISQNGIVALLQKLYERESPVEYSSQRIYVDTSNSPYRAYSQSSLEERLSNIINRILIRWMDSTLSHCSELEGEFPKISREFENIIKDIRNSECSVRARRD